MVEVRIDSEIAEIPFCNAVSIKAQSENLHTPFFEGWQGKSKAVYPVKNMNHSAIPTKRTHINISLGQYLLFTFHILKKIGEGNCQSPPRGNQKINF